MFSSLSWVYGQIGNLRNVLYDRGVFETRDLGTRTISIGNITTGGTGKTPLVGHVAGILAGRGEKVCILTRGYGRKNPKDRVLVSDGNEILADPLKAGDESFELGHKLIGKAIVIADADRTAAAEWAKRKFEITAFVLDDGFQHRKVKRDLDIVCVDATDPFGGGKMLPVGRLREPLRNLKRSDIVVITRANLADISNLKSEISELAPNAAIFVSNIKITRIVELEKFKAETPRMQKDENKKSGVVDWNQVRDAIGNDDGSEIRIAAFCALGNPDSFFTQLRNVFENKEMKGFDLTIAKSFPDHHFYAQKDVVNLQKQAKYSDIDAFVTTAKDAVKLSNSKFEIPCFVVEIEVCLDDSDGFAALL